MIYTCDKCKNTFNDEPGYLSYGIRKGQPFIEKFCKECLKLVERPDEVKPGSE